VGESYQKTMTYINKEILRYKFFPDLEKRPPVQAFGMGSAITNITGKRGNRRQHGCVITVERMQHLIDTRIDLYEESDITVETLLSGTNIQEELDDLERDLLVLYGLPVYQSLLHKYSLDRVTVCGYGLRYGVFLYHALPGLADRIINLVWTDTEELFDTNTKEIASSSIDI